MMIGHRIRLSMLETPIGPRIDGYTLDVLFGSRKIVSVLGSCLIAPKIILSTWKTLTGSVFGNSIFSIEAFLNQLLGARPPWDYF